MAVKPVPKGYHTVTPSLVVKGAAKLIDFVKEAFGGEELMRMPTPSGEIMHAEVRIGDSIVMLNDATQQQPTTSSLFLYVRDVDALYKRAVKAGATPVSEPADMFWGDRMAQGRIISVTVGEWRRIRKTCRRRRCRSAPKLR